MESRTLKTMSLDLYASPNVTHSLSGHITEGITVPIDKNHIIGESVDKAIAELVTSEKLPLLAERGKTLNVWLNEHGKPCVNVSEVIPSIKDAVKRAMSIGHRSLYIGDVRVNIPEPQRAGNSTQRSTYLEQTAEKLAKEFAYLINF